MKSIFRLLRCTRLALVAYLTDLLHRHSWQWQRQYFHLAPPWRGRDGWVYQKQCVGCGQCRGRQELRPNEPYTAAVEAVGGLITPTQYVYK